MAVTIVQKKTLISDDVGAASISFDTTPTVGNVIVVSVSVWVNASGGEEPAASAVSDNQGNTYTRDAKLWNTDANIGGLAYYSATASTSSGTFTVTFDEGAPTFYSSLIIYEVSGLAGTPFEALAVGGNTTDTAPQTSTSLTSAASGSLAMSAISHRAATSTQPSSPSAWTFDFQQDDNAAHIAGDFASLVMSGTPTITPVWSLDASKSWLCLAVIYKAAGGGSTTNTSLFATQRQASTRAATIAAARISVQTQTAFRSLMVSAIRIAAEAQATVLSKQPNIVRISPQAQATVLPKQVGIVRTLAQAQAATMTALKVLLRSLVATQAYAILLAKSIGSIRIAAQAQTLTRSAAVARFVLAAQAQTTTSIRAAARMLVVAAPTVATLAALKVLLRSLFAVQAQAAILAGATSFGRSLVAVQAQAILLVRQVAALRAAAQAQASDQSRNLAKTVAASQAQIAFVFRRVGIFFRVVQRALTTLLTLLPGASRPRLFYFSASVGSFVFTASRSTAFSFVATEEKFPI